VTVRRVLFWLAVAALALPAVPLTLNRLVDSSSGPAIRIMSFTPLATPWYVVEVLLLGVALVAGRAGPRKVVAPVLAVSVAGLGLHLWWLAPQYLGDNPAPAADAEQRVVMNLNLYEGRADGADVVRIAKDRDVSVLVLQEITFRALHELEDHGIDDLLPYRIGEPNGAVDGTMVFAREPLGPAVKLDTVFQSWQVVVGEGDDALTLVAAHPRAPVPPGSASSMLTEHAVLLGAAERSEADLVLGDMNATYDHAPMRAWRDAGWRDSLELVNAGWSRTWPANGITPAPGVHPPALIQIDHVLLGPRMAVTDSETIEVAGTDHLAVVATVARR
jgi:Endonuclease/Exonuclease/phosphatase family